MAALYSTIIDAAVTIIQALSLSGLSSSNVKKRALPIVGEVLDTLPCVVVCPSARNMTSVPLEAEGMREVVRWVDCVVIAAKNQDQTLPDDVLRWVEQIHDALAPPRALGIAGIFESDVEPWVPLDRRLLNENYAYSGITVGWHECRA